MCVCLCVLLSNCIVCFSSVYSGHQSILVPPLELETNASLWLSAVSQYKVRVTFCSYSVMEMCTKGLGSQTEALRVSTSHTPLRSSSRRTISNNLSRYIYIYILGYFSSLSLYIYREIEDIDIYLFIYLHIYASINIYAYMSQQSGPQPRYVHTITSSRPADPHCTQPLLL